MWRGCGGACLDCSRHHDPDNGHRHHHDGGDNRVLVRPYHPDAGGADDHAAWWPVDVCGAVIRIYPHVAVVAAAADHSVDCHSGDDA